MVSKNDTTDAELAEELRLQEEQEEDDYLKFFNEQNGGAKAPLADDDDDDSSVESDSDDSPDSKDLEDDDNDDDDGEAAVSKEPEKKPSSKGKASDATPKGKDDPYAWIDDLPEDVREQANALRHQHVSTKGRFSAYQRRIEEADTELASLRSIIAKRNESKSSRSKPDTQEEQQLSTQLQEFVDNYPQLAGAIKTLIANERQAIEQEIDERLGPITEKEIQTTVKAARDRLSEGASEIFNTPETGVHYTDVIKSPLYKDVFLQSMPAEYQKLAHTTSDPETALMIMRDFAEFAEQYAEENGLVEGEDAIVPRKPVSKADTVRTRRKARQQEAARPHQKSVATDLENTGSYEDDFRMWNHK